MNLDKKNLDKKKDKMIEITFLPEGRKVISSPPASLKEAILKSKADFLFPCGGKGICGKCKVKIKGKANPPTQKEKENLSFKELKQGYRLACQVILQNSAEVEIPTSSLISTLQILTVNSKESFKIKPSVKKIYLPLTPPTLKDQIPDVSRIKKELEKMGLKGLKMDIDVVKKVPFILRKSDFKVTAVVDNKEIITLAKGDTRGKNFGVALDVGTTTLVGGLIDLDTGEKVSTAALINPQNVHGYDVISRISYIQQKKSKGLKELQKRVVAGINEVIDMLVKKSKVKRDNIYQLTLAGNTVMQHLLAGINPLNLALYPYVPVLQDAIYIKSSTLGIKINPSATTYIFPSIASFVGGDTVGLILSTGLHRMRNKIRLAVDIGTNGEIVLSCKGGLVATSTAAGPAFEGVKISQGMLARKGAIEKVRLKEGEVSVGVVGNGEAEGICGSGLIDAVSELYREGIIDESGRIKPLKEQRKLWRDRIIEERGESKFLLAEVKRKPSIFITQRDIREFQIAKAAISTGIKVLLKASGIEKDRVEELLIAGGFGSYINVQNAYRVGLFPVFPQAKVKIVGNAALMGAIKALLSEDSRQEAEKIPSLVRCIELATRSDFQDILLESIPFSTIS